MNMSPPMTVKIAGLISILAMSPMPGAVVLAADAAAPVSSGANGDPESVTVTGKQVPHSLLNPGVVLGGVSGLSLARDLDPLDMPYALLALAQGLSGPLNEWYAWRSVRAGVEGRFFPTREFRDGSRLCRDFTAQSSGSQNQNTVLGSACRDGDGIWRLR